MTEDKTILEIKNLKKNFGKFSALKDITFNVHRGEIFGFIGPNGAGKSTTIRVLLGILKKSSGDVTIFGNDVWKDTVEIHKRLSYVPGDVYLWPNLTGGEIIDLFLKMNNNKHSICTDELIKKFDLDVTKKARTYSKGNRQKVALIAALSTDAELYIFDEPTSGLDPIMEEVFQQEVIDLKNSGKSILLSSHILSEVERMCDRIGIIREGKIIETGTLDEMRHLTRSQIIVSTKKDLSEISSNSYVHELSKLDEKLRFTVDSDHLDEVMNYLASKDILTLQCTPPTLEDLFLRYYKDNAKGVVKHE